MGRRAYSAAQSTHERCCSALLCVRERSLATREWVSCHNIYISSMSLSVAAYTEAYYTWLITPSKASM